MGIVGAFSHVSSHMSSHMYLHVPVYVASLWLDHVSLLPSLTRQPLRYPDMFHSDLLAIEQYASP